jgi:hypothetical protein
MSNRVEPILNTVLPELPKSSNSVAPLNIVSKKFDSFPPMATPKLQEIKEETIAFPGLRGITMKKEEEKVILPIIKEEKKKTEIIVPKKMFSLIDRILLIIFSIMIGIVTYNLLKNICNNTIINN